MKRFCLLITGLSLALLGSRAPGSAQVYDQPGDSLRQGGSGRQDTSLYGGQDSGMYRQDTSSQMGRSSGIYNDTTYRQGSSTHSDSTWRNESGKQGSGMWHDTTGRQGSGMWHDSTDRPGQHPNDKSGTYPDKSGTGSNKNDRSGEGGSSGTMKQGSSSSSGS